MSAERKIYLRDDGIVYIIQYIVSPSAEGDAKLEIQVQCRYCGNSTSTLDGSSGESIPCNASGLETNTVNAFVGRNILLSYTCQPDITKVCPG